MTSSMLHGDSFDSRRWLFNSPLECGFRLLFVLCECAEIGADVQRLVSYDYLIVHSGDIQGGPESLHPPVPFRGTEWLVKRDLVNRGAELMVTRELLEKRLDSTGITYWGTNLTKAFVSLLKSEYAEALRKRSRWISSEFGSMANPQLQQFMTDNVGKWGAEFDKYSTLRYLDLS